jgi:hypothetical protein
MAHNRHLCEWIEKAFLSFFMIKYDNYEKNVMILTLNVNYQFGAKAELLCYMYRITVH